MQLQKKRHEYSYGLSSVSTVGDHEGSDLGNNYNGNTCRTQNYT